MLLKPKIYFYIALLTLPSILLAAPECEIWIAKMVSAKGQVEKQRLHQTTWRQVEKNEYFCQGDRIRTKKNSLVTLELGNESLVTMEQSSAMAFPILDQGSFSWLLELFRGGAFFRSRSPHQLKIDTPFVNAVHEGTEFMVVVTEQQTEIIVFNGKVAAENQSGRVLIGKGQMGITAKNQITQVQPLTIRPEDAVQWTLYYPPIVDYQRLASILTIPGIKKALKLYHRGSLFQALEVLNNIPKQQRDEHYIALKASLLLSVGNVEEALLEINQAEPRLETALSSGLAIKAIIAVSKNRTEEASVLALKATQLNPESAIAKIALSYVYQAQFKIDKALTTIKQATQLSPENALAWARLAELQLSTGNKKSALESAQKAQLLNPQLDRTKTILGFAYLAQIDMAEAETAFTHAIELNSANPLARLGLGLTKIRRGVIEEGTRDLETAVSLDPNSAIMRSYLGKAYYELRNEGYAATELTIAKDMDPNDPTPWFYDAILKQTNNRPIEALQDMQKAIELNGNRGVYRSKLLLDEDLAARSASLGRIYNDLGFQQLGLVEGWKSVTLDPSNYSAHRLLADNYAALPRHEIARVSALLQSQLLQPINITPIQPSLAESDRLASNTLGSTSFNEYNSLFERNQFTIQGSGNIGNNDSYGEEIVHAGIWNKLSYSIGQYHYQSDGIRKNNAIKQDIYNAFAQYQITSDLNLQFEYRYNFLKNGDLSQQFNRHLFSDSLQEKFKRQLYRIGANYQPDPTTNVLFSAIYTKDDFSSGLSSIFLGENTTTTVEDNADTFSFELQLIKDADWAKFIAGASYIYNNQPQDALVVQNIHIPAFIIPGFFSIPAKDIALEINSQTDHDSDHINAYLYTFLSYKNLTGILGVSFDSINSHFLPDIQRFNPKLGLLWNLTNSTTFRAAYFQGVKKIFGANQTIEPVQVAGFVQFFDDDAGSKYEHFGIGLDHKFSQSAYAGLEGTYRKLDVPLSKSKISLPLIGFDSPSTIRVKSNSEFIKYERQNEFTVRSYFNWTPTKRISASIEYQLVIHDRQIAKELSNRNPLINDVVTHQVPISINYFATNGLYSKFQTTFIHQKINSDESSNSGNEHFWSIDALVGYKFPKRYGRLEFGVKNLLNENYQYADKSLVTGLPSRARYLPERTIFSRLIFDFDF
jgi:Flp pilus assembly protein TadD